MSVVSEIKPQSKVKPSTIKEHLESEKFKLAIAKVLPKHVTPERMAKIALTALSRQPKLAECDQVSFFRCMMELSQLGLEPDGRHAHLIPFKNRERGVVECQLIIDYKGLLELAFRSGAISSVHADVVCEQDRFDYDRGELIAHKIDFQKPRGPVYAAYSLVRMKDGTEKCEVLSLEEINLIRSRSKAGGSGPWVTDFNEMAKKTAFRRVSKWIPLSAEVREAVELNTDEVIDGVVIEGVNSSQPRLSSSTEDFQVIDARISDSDQEPSERSEIAETEQPVDDVPDNEAASLLLSQAKLDFEECASVSQVQEACRDRIQLVRNAGWSEELRDATVDAFTEAADARIIAIRASRGK